MFSWQPPKLKPFLRLASITIIELFLITNFPIPISINCNIRSLVGSEEAVTRQLMAASIQEAPVSSFCLSPPLATATKKYFPSDDIRRMEILRGALFKGKITPREVCQEILTYFSPQRIPLPSSVIVKEPDRYALGPNKFSDIREKLTAQFEDLFGEAAKGLPKPEREKAHLVLEAFLNEKWDDLGIDIDSMTPREVEEIAYQLIKCVTGNYTPLRDFKDIWHRAGIGILPNIQKVIDGIDDDFERLHKAAELVVLANVGGTSVFMKGARDNITSEGFREILDKNIGFFRDDSRALFDRLSEKKAQQILILPDNFPEEIPLLIFVRLLVKMGHTVILAAKHDETDVDMTKEDLDGLFKLSGARELFSDEELLRIKIISTGSRTRGVDPRRPTPEFLEAWQKADIIISVGEGNSGTLGTYATKDYFKLVYAKSELEAGGLKPGTGVIEFIKATLVKLEQEIQPAVPGAQAATLAESERILSSIFKEGILSPDEQKKRRQDILESADFGSGRDALLGVSSCNIVLSGSQEHNQRVAEDAVCHPAKGVLQVIAERTDDPNLFKEMSQAEIERLTEERTLSSIVILADPKALSSADQEYLNRVYFDGTQAHEMGFSHIPPEAIRAILVPQTLEQVVRDVCPSDIEIIVVPNKTPETLTIYREIEIGAVTDWQSWEVNIAVPDYVSVLTEYMNNLGSGDWLIVHGVRLYTPNDLSPTMSKLAVPQIEASRFSQPPAGEEANTLASEEEIRALLSVVDWGNDVAVRLIVNEFRNRKLTKFGAWLISHFKILEFYARRYRADIIKLREDYSHTDVENAVFDIFDLMNHYQILYAALMSSGKDRAEIKNILELGIGVFEYAGFYQSELPNLELVVGIDNSHNSDSAYMGIVIENLGFLKVDMDKFRIVIDKEKGDMRKLDNNDAIGNGTFDLITSIHPSVFGVKQSDKEDVLKKMIDATMIFRGIASRMHDGSLLVISFYGEDFNNIVEQLGQNPFEQAGFRMIRNFNRMGSDILAENEIILLADRRVVERIIGILRPYAEAQGEKAVESSPRNIGGFWCGQNHNGLSQVKHRVIIEEGYSIFKLQKEFPKEGLDGLLAAESFYVIGDKEAIGIYGLTICVGVAGIVKTRGGKNVGFVDHFSVMCDIPASLAEIKGLLMDKYNLTVEEISQMQIYIVGGAYAYAPERIEEIKMVLESLGIGKLSIEATGFEAQLFVIDIVKNCISVKGFETKKQGDKIILSDISKILSSFEANMENRKIKKVIVQYGDKVNAEIKPIKGIGEDKQAYNQLVITIANNSPPSLGQLVGVIANAL